MSQLDLMNQSLNSEVKRHKAASESNLTSLENLQKHHQQCVERRSELAEECGRLSKLAEEKEADEDHTTDQPFTPRWFVKKKEDPKASCLDVPRSEHRMSVLLQHHPADPLPVKIQGSTD